MEITKIPEFEREEMLRYMRLCVETITALKLQIKQLESIINDMRVKIVKER